MRTTLVYNNSYLQHVHTTLLQHVHTTLLQHVLCNSYKAMMNPTVIITANGEITAAAGKEQEESTVAMEQ